MNRRYTMLSLAAMALVSACGQGAAPRPRAHTAKRKVALLLPLSGSRATLGKRMAKAVWLVEDTGGTSGRTQILDAGETPSEAASAAARAISEGANTLVGPLFRQQTPAVVHAAGDVPVISLSNDDTLAAAGAWVFGVTPAQSARAVMEYAKKSGAKRVTMLRTGSALDQPAAKVLAKEAKSSGIAALAPVPADTSAAGMAQALRQSGGGRLPDVVYVPTSGPKAVSQAVAAVRTGVTTIGSLQWSGLPPKDLTRLDKACFTGPDPVRFNRLSATFAAHLGGEMGVIAALAVDAVAFAHTSGRSIAGRNPTPGLLGAATFRADKTCDRTLSILRIDGGAVRLVA